MVLAGVWLACSMMRAGGLLREAVRLRRLRDAARPLVCSSALTELLEAGKGRVSLRHSNAVERPGVVGFRSPCILLPSSVVERLDEAELGQVILHELEHLRRRDDWLNLLQKLSLVLMPLSPALLWIDRRLCFERELACDEGVVKRACAPRSYALLLAKLAELGLEQRTTSLILGAMERPSQLARRVYRILEAPRSPSSMERWMVPAGLAMALAAGSAGLARCPELVGFGGLPASAATISASALASATPRVLYGETGLSPELVRSSLVMKVQHPVKLRRKVRKRQAVNVRLSQAVSLQPIVDALAASIEMPLEVPATQLPLPVGYRLVRVEGGWLLIQL